MSIYVLSGKKNLRRYKVRIDGADTNGKNTTRQLLLLADSIDEVVDSICAALGRPHDDVPPPTQEREP